jgi:ABC-type uncharacterized transport system substrate-binding protein
MVTSPLSAMIVTGKPSSSEAVVVVCATVVDVVGLEVVVSGSGTVVPWSDEVEHAATARAIAARRTDVRISMGCLQSLEEATVAE